MNIYQKTYIMAKATLDLITERVDAEVAKIYPKSVMDEALLTDDTRLWLEISRYEDQVRHKHGYMEALDLEGKAAIELIKHSIQCAIKLCKQQGRGDKAKVLAKLLESERDRDIIINREKLIDLSLRWEH